VISMSIIVPINRLLRERRLGTASGSPIEPERAHESDQEAENGSTNAGSHSNVRRWALLVSATGLSNED
jgi:hypothetical protein